MRELLNILIDYGKVKVTFFVAVSAAVGYILAKGSYSPEMFVVMAGVFLLSWSSAALNQYQERFADGLMSRTMNRPLPSEKIQPGQGIAAVIVSGIAGAALLLVFSGLYPFFLGIAALIWYNLVYTPLKRITALAVLPGAVIGAIPPAIGWTAAGGSLASPQIWAIGLFFFIWQIPHFWLLMLLYEDDYRKAGFPVLSDIFERPALQRITYVWTVALAVSCLLIPLFGSAEISPASCLILIAAGVVLILRTRSILGRYYSRAAFRFTFAEINIYALISVLVITIDKLLI